MSIRGRNETGKEHKTSRGSLKLKYQQCYYIKQEIEYDFGEQLACYRLVLNEETNDLRAFLRACHLQFLKFLKLERDANGCIRVWIKLKLEGITEKYFDASILHPKIRFI